MAKWGTKGTATAGRSHDGATSGGDNRDHLALHRSRCQICKHPEREEIERE